MKKIKKILKTLIIFILIMLFICLLLTIIDLFNNNITFSEIPNKIGLYFLYIIGYGGLEEDIFIQNILAILGIISIALMTTYLTIELFWRDTDIVLNTKYDNNKLYFNIINKGNTICDVKLSFTIYDYINNINNSNREEYYIPIIDKHAKWSIVVDINDTFWYNTLKNIINNKNKLYYMLSFVDTKNGQSSICINEINDINISLDELLKPIVIDALDSIESNEFIMQYANFHDNMLNLDKYGYDNIILTFNAYTLVKLNLVVEVKTVDNKYSKEFLLNKGNNSCIMDFKDCNILLEDVKEICFTLFKNNNKIIDNVKYSDIKINITNK